MLPLMASVQCFSTFGSAEEPHAVSSSFRWERHTSLSVFLHRRLRAELSSRQSSRLHNERIFSVLTSQMNVKADLKWPYINTKWSDNSQPSGYPPVHFEGFPVTHCGPSVTGPFIRPPSISGKGHSLFIWEKPKPEILLVMSWYILVYFQRKQTAVHSCTLLTSHLFVFVSILDFNK